MFKSKPRLHCDIFNCNCVTVADPKMSFYSWEMASPQQNLVKTLGLLTVIHSGVAQKVFLNNIFIWMYL